VEEGEEGGGEEGVEGEMAASSDEDGGEDEDEEGEKEGYGERWLPPCCVLRRRWPAAKKAVVGDGRRSRTRTRTMGRKESGAVAVKEWWVEEGEKGESVSVQIKEISNRHVV